MSDASQEKDRLRKMLVEQRMALSPAEVIKASTAVAERIRALSEWKNAWSVLLYWPIKNEIDTRPLLAELWERGAIALLPRCRPEQPGFMDLCACACEEDLTAGSFNIMEPAPCCATREDSGEPFVPDLVLVPAVAFDCPSGPAEIIRPEVDGLLVPPGDVAALAAAVARLMGDEPLRRAMAARAPEVLHRFGLEKVLDLWEALFNDARRARSSARGTRS